MWEAHPSTPVQSCDKWGPCALCLLVCGALYAAGWPPFIEQPLGRGFSWVAILLPFLSHCFLLFRTGLGRWEVGGKLHFLNCFAYRMCCIFFSFFWIALDTLELAGENGSAQIFTFRSCYIFKSKMYSCIPTYIDTHRYILSISHILYLIHILPMIHTHTALGTLALFPLIYSWISPLIY